MGGPAPSPMISGGPKGAGKALLPCPASPVPGTRDRAPAAPGMLFPPSLLPPPPPSTAHPALCASVSAPRPPRGPAPHPAPPPASSRPRIPHPAPRILRRPGPMVSPHRGLPPGPLGCPRSACPERGCERGVLSRSGGWEAKPRCLGGWRGRRAGQELCPPGSSRAGLAWGVQTGPMGGLPVHPSSDPPGASHAFGIDVPASAPHGKGRKWLYFYVLRVFGK